MTLLCPPAGLSLSLSLIPARACPWAHAHCNMHGRPSPYHWLSLHHRTTHTEVDFRTASTMDGRLALSGCSSLVWTLPWGVVSPSFSPSRSRLRLRLGGSIQQTQNGTHCYGTVVHVARTCDVVLRALFLLSLRGGAAAKSGDSGSSRIFSSKFKSLKF